MSEEIKHTDGPWRIGQNRSSVVSDNPSPGVNGSDDVEYYGGHLICESVSKPNAKLIAAAPDFLKALQDIAKHQSQAMKSLPNMAMMSTTYRIAANALEQAGFPLEEE